MEWACLYMMPGGMILFVTLEGCWNMDLTNIEFINSDFREFAIETTDNTLVYCDPPYSCSISFCLRRAEDKTHPALGQGSS